MIQLSGAGKRFGHKLLFENTDWLITPHDRVGLVGANGTGKSTLMKVLASLDTFDYGSLIVAKGTTAARRPLAFWTYRFCRVHDGVHWIACHRARARRANA
jgi:ATP-binding cassette subfamily F protein 3